MYIGTLRFAPKLGRSEQLYVGSLPFLLSKQNKNILIYIYIYTYTGRILKKNSSRVSVRDA